MWLCPKILSHSSKLLRFFTKRISEKRGKFFQNFFELTQLARRYEAVIVCTQIQFFHQQLDHRKLWKFQEWYGNVSGFLNFRRKFDTSGKNRYIFTRISHLVWIHEKQFRLCDSLTKRWAPFKVFSNIWEIFSIENKKFYFHFKMKTDKCCNKTNTAFLKSCIYNLCQKIRKQRNWTLFLDKSFFKWNKVKSLMIS